MCFLHSDLERIEKHFAQKPFGKVGWSNVGATFRLPMRAKMLERGDDMPVIDIRPTSLKSLNCGNAHTRHEIRIFAVGFLHSAPARIAREIEHWRST